MGRCSFVVILVGWRISGFSGFVWGYVTRALGWFRGGFVAWCIGLCCGWVRLVFLGLMCVDWYNIPSWASSGLGGMLWFTCEVWGLWVSGFLGLCGFG